MVIDIETSSTLRPYSNESSKDILHLFFLRYSLHSSILNQLQFTAGRKCVACIDHRTIYEAPYCYVSHLVFLLPGRLPMPAESPFHKHTCSDSATTRDLLLLSPHSPAYARKFPTSAIAVPEDGRFLPAYGDREGQD